jgi:transcriptional regulator with XRE-family HTH domain
MYLGLTGAQLGDMCGVSKVAVSNWEAGITNNIKLQTFRRLLKALDVDYDYLIFGPLEGDDRRADNPVTALRTKVHP